MSRASLAIFAAAALVPGAIAAAPAGAATSDDPGFQPIGGFGICWYGDTRPDNYFGVNVRCPLQPMPGDNGQV
ncbi:MAG TPA: hypothetical protein VGJ70_20880 [Solirubrobacteraceae bacterium]